MSKIDIDLVAVSRREGGKARLSTLLTARCTGETGRTSTIRVRNLSEAGFGGKVLEGPMPQLGEDVAIELRGGQRVYGQVAWLRRGEAGIAFDLPLNVESLRKAGALPSFAVADIHAGVGTGGTRPGLKAR